MISTKSLFLLYNALIVPFLNYCNIVWGNCNKTKINTLLLLQKRAIRICSHTNYLAHTTPIFKRMKTLKAEDIHTFQTAIFMYKYVTNLLPPSFQNFFTNNANILSYPTRRSTDFHLNNPRTLLAHKTIRLMDQTFGIHFPRHSNHGPLSPLSKLPQEKWSCRNIKIEILWMYTFWLITYT